ncbi:hypothetical protein D3875_04200 [Deinococcus cavernae]|uniref:Uncharacterized protein n=1 Tax=Deinococcus cavernae TaxID=2320857 RepID=A0A418VEF8_9DEIO|nr:hypothetical protein [Deinococcus cavernae]RJF74489.1 hypothetical protein D3875_04200 [Deinococcus cavernae]
MPKWNPVQVNLTSEEAEVLEAAAKRAGMPVEVYIKNAALTVTREVPSKRSGHELMWIHREAASRGHTWTEEELREKELPLYWSEAWVRARLAEGLSIQQLAVLSGAHKNTVDRHLDSHFGISAGKRVLTSAEVQTIHQRFAAGETRPAIARSMGLSKTTVSQYLRDQPSFYEQDADAAIQRSQPHLESPPLDADEPWHKRLLAQQLAAVNPWPAPVAQIADQLFNGNRSVTRTWASKQFKDGHLVRPRYGWYDLARK